MLARTPKVSAAASNDYAALLKVPAIPPSLVEADAAWKKAVADRDEAREAHVEAVRMRAAQMAGQPTQITQRAVDDLGERLGPLFEAEEKARSTRDTERANYEAATNATLTNGLEMFRDELSAKLNELDRVLDHGFRLDAEVRVARLRIGNGILGRVGNLRSSVEQMRRLLQTSRT